VRTYTLLRNVCGPSDRKPSACHPAGSLIKSYRGKTVSAYHCRAKIVSRSKGQSAIAKAAYNARDRLVDEKTGETKNYSRNEDQVLFSGIFAPKDAPAWAQDREQLWNQAEAAEKRKDAQLAREIVVALPHELTQQQREWLIKDFVRENFTRAGMVADVNMHAPSREGDERNIHAHILLTTREIGPDGFGQKVRDWNDKELLEKWREDYAEKGAKMLERAGFEIEAERFRHGHLTLPEQREKALERGDLEFAESSDRAPTTHKGPEICQMEKRGAVSYVQEQRNEEAANDNQYRSELAALRAELAGVEKQIERSESRDESERAGSPSGFIAQNQSGQEPEAVQIEKAAGLVFDATAEVIGKSTDFVADSFSSLFEAKPKQASPADMHRAQERAEAKEQREQEEDLKKGQVDFARYVSDQEYRFKVMKQQAEEREAQRKREESYEQQFGRERERDRDRDR
jgi:hypothetical protein